MSKQTIDQLNIEIQAQATDATKSIRTLKKAVKDLKKEMSELSSEGASAVKVLDDVSDVAETSVGSKTTKNSWNSPLTASSLLNLKASVRVVQDLARGLASAVTRASDLTEVMNLFSVAMGENAQEGLQFINMLENGLGISALDSANYMSQFYQISNALGVVDEKALKLSKDFTKLTYDLSSLFNIGFEQSFEKLRAGLVGETEPLRQLGITITEANLAETARRLGIEKSIRTMTEAEKIELRYVTVMQMASNAMNDFERTQDTLGNAVRKAQAQFQLLAQTIGQVFVPILTKTMPYIIAFVQLLGDAVRWIAGLFGIVIEPLSVVSNAVSDMSTGISDFGDGLSSATGKAKKLKNALMGFDELNVLPDTSASGGGGSGLGGGIGGGGLGIDFDKFGYEDYIKGFSDQVSQAKENLEKLIPIIKNVALVAGTIWAGFKIASIVKGVKGIIGWLAGLVLKFSASEMAVGAFVKVATVMSNPIVAGVTVATVALAGLIAKGFQPAIKSADIFGDGISDVTKRKLEPFMDTLEQVDQQLLGFEVCDQIITQEDVNGLQLKLTQLTDSILNELDADRNQALADLSLLENVLTEEEYQELIARNTAMYDELEADTQQAHDRILEITQQASNEKRDLTEAEVQEISELRRQMLDTAINCMSEEASETEIIRQRIKDNTLATSLESASGVIQNAIKARDEAIAKAQEQYDGVVDEATKMLLAGEINEEEYQKIIDSAEEARELTIQEAKDQFKGIYDACAEKFPEVTKFINEENGKIKNNFQVKWDEIKEKWRETLAWFNEKVADFKNWCNSMTAVVKDFVNNKIAPFFTKEKWKEIAKGILEGLEHGFKTAINSVTGMFNKFIGWINSKLRIDIPAIVFPEPVGKIFDGFSKQLFTIPDIPYLAKGGVVDHATLAMIGEQGKEAVVPLENNTEWMRTVAKGISAELGGSNVQSSQPVEVVLQVRDRELGRVVIDSINQLQRQSGRVLLNV